MSERTDALITELAGACIGMYADVIVNTRHELREIISILERELAETKAREERKDRLLQECRGHLKGWKMSMLASTPERLLAKIEAVLQQNGDTK